MQASLGHHSCTDFYTTLEAIQVVLYTTASSLCVNSRQLYCAGMFGDLEDAVATPMKAMAAIGSTMTGIGFTAEAIKHSLSYTNTAVH